MKINAVPNGAVVAVRQCVAGKQGLSALTGALAGVALKQCLSFLVHKG